MSTLTHFFANIAIKIRLRYQILNYVFILNYWLVLHLEHLTETRTPNRTFLNHNIWLFNMLLTSHNMSLQYNWVSSQTSNSSFVIGAKHNTFKVQLSVQVDSVYRMVYLSKSSLKYDFARFLFFLICYSKLNFAHLTGFFVIFWVIHQLLSESVWTWTLMVVVVYNKSSLSLGRTSAGIVFCFWGIFDTVRGSHIIKCIFTFLSQNPKHLEYKKYVQSKSGN